MGQIKTQEQVFQDCNTDFLLTRRYLYYCDWPEFEGQKPTAMSDANVYPINKGLLYAELNKREHRVRKHHKIKKTKNRNKGSTRRTINRR